MANPAVDKIKDLALRHGEKAVVGIASALCLVMVFFALSKETIDTTPEQLAQLSTSAQNNLQQRQDENTILQKLEGDGMVLQNFEKKVASREEEGLDVRQVALSREFVRPQPGAGLIRDGVENQLLAPYDLFASPVRGGIAVYELDSSGNLIAAEPGDRSLAPPPGMFDFEGDMGMPGGGGETKSQRDEQIAKKQEELDRRRTQSTVKGAATGTSKTETAKAQASRAAEYKERVDGRRVVSIIGVLDHKRLRDRFARALKQSYDVSHPDYQRLEVERQVYDPINAEWSDWTKVARAEEQEVVKYAAYEHDEDPEFSPAEVRLDPLVDFLPYLVTGDWSGIYHGRFVDASILNPPEDDTNLAAGGGGRGLGMGGFGMDMEGMGDYGMGDGMGMGDYGMGDGMGMGMEGMGDYGMGMRGGGASNVEFTSDAEVVLVRALDFTVRPDTTYRYRVCIVVKNPNYDRQDVARGVDNESRELTGPWSEPSEVVTVPPDVTAYAMAPALPTAARPRADQVQFDVIAWNPESGVTAHKTFTAAPGEFIGEPSSVRVRIEGKEDTETQSINFNSRQLIFDTLGGKFSTGAVGVTGIFDVPAVAAVLRPDGSIAVRNQARDQGDEQLAFMKESYRLSISDEVNKKDKSMMGLGGFDMDGMGGMGGMDGYGPGL